MKTSFLCLCAALVFLVSGQVAGACQYCEMMASDPEAARFNSQVGAQNFPLEGVTSQYQAPAPSANLAVPPAAASVVTKASDLPTTIIRRPVAPLPAAAAKPVPAVAAVRVNPAASSHWADAGLLSLAAAGGLFWLRTRRTDSPLS